MILHPNNSCVYYRASGVDKYAKKTFDAPETIECVLISVNIDMVKSSVRADADASRGRSEGLNGQARLLLPDCFKPAEGDYILIDEMWLEVKAIFPRKNLFGDLDHWQVDCRPAKDLSVCP